MEPKQRVALRQWSADTGILWPGSQGYFLTSQRNQIRVPFYNRIDVRLSKAFLFKKWKLTLTGEVLNVFNRKNVRYAGFDFFTSTDV